MQELQDDVEQPVLRIVHPPPDHRGGRRAGDGGREVHGLEQLLQAKLFDEEHRQHHRQGCGHRHDHQRIDQGVLERLAEHTVLKYIEKVSEPEEGEPLPQQLDLEEAEIERLHRRPDPEERKEDDHRCNKGIRMEVVAAVHPPHGPAGGVDHTVILERDMRKQAGLPPAFCGRPPRTRGYFAASAMALFPACAASPSAWSTVASPCHALWIPAPSACMTPSSPRFMGYRRPYFAILSSA